MQRGDGRICIMWAQYLYKKAHYMLNKLQAHIVILFHPPLFPLLKLSQTLPFEISVPSSSSLCRSAMAAPNSIFTTAPSRNLAPLSLHQSLSSPLSPRITRSHSVAFRPKPRSSSLVFCSTDESNTAAEKEIPIELSKQNFLYNGILILKKKNRKFQLK